MAAAREVMWIRAITAASASSARRTLVLPSSLTTGTYKTSKDLIQRLTLSSWMENAPGEKADRWGIYVGLWAPTFMALGNAIQPPKPATSPGPGPASSTATHRVLAPPAGPAGGCQRSLVWPNRVILDIDGRPSVFLSC